MNFGLSSGARRVFEEVDDVVVENRVTEAAVMFVP